MGLYNISQQQYYTTQFTSLEDIINQFMVVYVGEEKIIPKVKRTDVAFHAQRAMQELSFDTFKSIKSQEIELPPSLTMILPHDYVNYTKISSVDGSGIKHVLYPTSKTSNPFKVLQEADGSYDLTLNVDAVFENGDFSSTASATDYAKPSSWDHNPNHGNQYGANRGVKDGRYEWKHVAQYLGTSNTGGRHYALWQEINVQDIDFITLSAKGLSSSASSGNAGVGVVRIGFSTLIDENVDSVGGDPLNGYNPNKTNPFNVGPNQSFNMFPEIFDVNNLDATTSTNYIEFSAGDDTMSSAVELTDIDVSGLDTVFILAVSSGGVMDDSNTVTGTSNNPNLGNNTQAINAIDDVVLTFEALSSKIQSGGESTTWSNYKSNKPSENTQHDYDYDDHIFEANVGRRYGIDPQHAQDNGSFYIDNLRGLINFSSNISGQTVVLDYISDGLGSEEEMVVHKFAQEAMYKYITHAILSTRSNTPEYQIARFKKEKSVAIRKAKLRLSNVKIEELTQILRGKSKQIKH